MGNESPVFTISIASSLLTLHPRTLMLYERFGLIEPHRTGTQRRLYSIEDLNHLQFVKHLTRKEHINLRGVKMIIEAIKIAEKQGVKLKELLFPTFKPQRII